MLKIEGFEVTGADGTSRPKESECRVQLGGLELWFSYKTLVAFRWAGSPVKCCENVFSRTTGKYLNQIEPDHRNRLPVEEFKREAEILVALFDAMTVAHFRAEFLAAKNKLKEVDQELDSIEAGVSAIENLVLKPRRRGKLTGKAKV